VSDVRGQARGVAADGGGGAAGPIQQEWRRLVQKYAEMHVPAWLRLYSSRGGFSIRCHCEGLAEDVIGSAMAPSRAGISRGAIAC